MRGLLDEQALDGAHEVQLTYRPERVGIPLFRSRETSISTIVRYVCQIWGGAINPILPVEEDGSLNRDYVNVLTGAAVDRISGAGAFHLFHLPSMKLKPAEQQQSVHGYQLAVALLQHGQQDKYQILESVALEDEDPWRDIYAACLGLLPESPDREILKAGYFVPELTFENYLRVQRPTVSGSLDDLLERLHCDDIITPRMLSMIHLRYGNAGNTGIRSERQILPAPKFPIHDAGPNVIVICSPGNLDDVALLWNLRGAHGDFRPLPIGVPSAVATPEVIGKLAQDPRISRNGFAVRQVYVTSASLSRKEIIDLIGKPRIPLFEVVDLPNILTFGFPGGWTREEVLVWKDGSSRFVPLPAGFNKELFTESAFGDLTRMRVDIDVIDSPFPLGDDVRIDAPNGEFYAGRLSGQTSPRSRSDVRDVEWPSPGLIARAVASSRNIDLSESDPGRVARIALEGLSDLWQLVHLAHAPLLNLLEEMSARQGFGWYKKRLQDSGKDVDPSVVVGSVIDELPEKSFNDFKRVLGNNDRAARYWLLWAEQSKLILKGFPLRCPRCRSKQWLPIAAFAPPIICRGCAEDIETPFGDRPIVEFRYRISERLRSAFEKDAVGHLLVARFFDALLGHSRRSHIVGVHPGMEARRQGGQKVEGEADLLILTQEAKFVPVEVKRTHKGVIQPEVDKLDRLKEFLGAPWSAIAVCQYGLDVPDKFSDLVERHPDGSYSRMLLSYDRLLEQHPTWAIADDPFAWEPLSAEEIKTREERFVKYLASQEEYGDFDWLESRMLRKPEVGES